MSYKKTATRKRKTSFTKYLRLDNNLDSHLKPVKIGEEQTGLQLADKDVKVENDLTVGGGVVNTDGNFIVDAGGDITLDSGTGIFIAKKAGTEFSASNSAYAGMILGYTDIGLDETRVSYTMTTSYAVPTDEFGVTFVAPPSGNVEIMVSFRYNAGGNGLGDLYVGLSDANATSGYNAVEDFHEELIRDGMGRDELTTIQNYWTLTGLTAGTSYTRWLGVKSSNLIGSPTLEYGGSATGHNPDFIMKATALPATIAT